MRNLDWQIIAASIGLLFCIFGYVAATVWGIQLAQPTTILVGQGCEGPSSIAVAWEEDRLPRCARIDRHEVK